MANLVAPPLCLLCSDAVRAGGSLCPACLAELPLAGNPCARCSSGAGDPREPVCPLCRDGVLALPLRHAGWHRGKLRELILAAKWHDFAAAARPLGEIAAQQAAFGGWCDGLDAHVAVPRDPLRRLLRGPPLAEAIGAEVGRILQLPRLRAPRRSRRAPQAGLGAEARRRNLRGAFRLTKSVRRRFAGRRVLVIDDVLTTGHTLEEFARVLRAAGAATVQAIVVAAAPLDSPGAAQR